MNYKEYLDIAKTAAKKAGDFLRERDRISVDSSEGRDIKLSSDILSESIIVETLSPTGLPVLSEESHLTGDFSDLFWIVDPLDGTMNYYKGMDDLACVSIALWRGDSPVLGVINRFARDEVFAGIVGGSAELNGMAICPSDVGKTEQAVIAAGFPVKRDYSEESLMRFLRLIGRFKKVRMLGSAALMAVFAACGRVDAYFEEGIMLWDIAAAAAIAEAAGCATFCDRLEGYSRVYRCFANKRLMEDFNAKGV